MDFIPGKQGYATWECKKCMTCEVEDRIWMTIIKGPLVKALLILPHWGERSYDKFTVIILSNQGLNE